jgi:hypothetical protein
MITDPILDKLNPFHINKFSLQLHVEMLQGPPSLNSHHGSVPRGNHGRHLHLVQRIIMTRVLPSISLTLHVIMLYQFLRCYCNCCYCY